ncbi:hypothetical protein N0V93_000708 [Gnomoniopsis smithogilvyi]|uniref:BZIP transcription factor n=1 Tax=Gnomoniopsis smithogilvyi TaxID=1191159 RepID=A0A9W8Z0N9_9PEZI|nr:hypothetical protein N0V93_000708 [Gnomoniopsis smithogilvyi]
MNRTMSPSTTPTDTPKTAKRKGTRSVSSLTPAQLARKRANDREAQRAIRARTKEHIDKLERTIDQLKAEKEDGFGKVLMERNRVLEEEIKNLTNQATAAGLPIHHSSSYLNLHNEELQSMRNAAMNPRSQQYGQTIRASSDPFTNGYTHLATPHGMPTPDPAEGWSSAPLSAIPVTVTTAVSSPASCGPSDDYRYHSSSAPMIEPISVPPTSVPYQHDIEYENGVDSSSEDTQSRLHHEYSRDQHFSRPQSNHHHHSSMGHSYSMHHQNQGGWASIYASPPVYAGGYPNNPSM